MFRPASNLRTCTNSSQAAAATLRPRPHSRPPSNPHPHHPPASNFTAKPKGKLFRSSSRSRSSSSSTSSQGGHRYGYRPKSNFLRTTAVLLFVAPAAATLVVALPVYPLTPGRDESAGITNTPSLSFSLWPVRTFSSTTKNPHPEDEMADAPQSLPPTANIGLGRPETLTKEQEAKLKEFWSATLKVFGVVGAGGGGGGGVPDAAAASEDSAADSPSTDGAGEEKTKKKRSLGRLLSRRDKGKDTKKENGSSGSGAVMTANGVQVVTSLDDSDDKYGHNKDFKTALADQTPAELRAAFWSMVKCDNPDGLLLRFLRARKWDVDKALVMMVVTMHWIAKEMNVAEIVRKGESDAITGGGDEGFVKQLRMGKTFLHGVDKEGRPICVVRVRLHRQGDQSEQSLERYTIYIIETARLMLRSPVDTACVVFDMTNFSLANMDYAPVKFMIKMFEAHYPESLGICLVHKAPWVFQGVWSIIKGWLDPVVASKIHFTRNVEELEEFIPRSQILKELGGDEDWEYNYIEPVEGEDDLLNDTARLEKLQAERDDTASEYEDLTRAWINAAEGEESDEVKSRRTGLAKKLDVGYWSMDRHLRGRTFYDRTGVLQQDGTLTFYRTEVGVAQSNNGNNEDDID